MALSGIDMRIADYDGRTALHLAAAEGQLHVVRFLLEKCKVPLMPTDRYATHFFLLQYCGDMYVHLHLCSQLITVKVNKCILSYYNQSKLILFSKGWNTGIVWQYHIVR
jgi:ankyrin repeat protein